MNTEASRALLRAVLAVVLGAVTGLASAPGRAQAPTPEEAPPAGSAPLLSAGELDTLVGRIALYPDELLAIVLPASTFPLEVVQAGRFLEKRKSQPDLEPSESWDPSVLGLLNYPEVVALMSGDLDWLEAFGTAVVNQQQDVMDAIQDFRNRTFAAGNLKSDDKQVVVQEKETIIIQPAQPEVIYVPHYDPAVVVVHHATLPYYYYPTPYPYYYSPAATFWTGMFVGAAVAYGIGGYNGWRRGDVTVNRNVNVNRGDRNVNISRGGSTWKPSRPAGGRPVGSRPGYTGARPGAGRPSAGGGGARPPAGTGSRPSAGAGTRPAQPRAGTRPSQPSAGARPSQPSAGVRPSAPSAGARPAPSRQPSRNAFGDYGRGSQTARQSQRGAQSRAAARPRGGGGRRGGRR